MNKNIKWQDYEIDREKRGLLLNQQPVTYWFTGLSGSGKSTLANALDKYLYENNYHSYVLDGDNIRCGLNSDLGFTKEDRCENIRRIAEVSKLLNDAGIIVITAFISPYKKDRDLAKQIIGEEYFKEIYVSTPLLECEKRDKKGLYMKARRGEIANFTGITDIYEEPDNPDLKIDTTNITVEEALNYIIDKNKVKQK